MAGKNLYGRRWRKVRRFILAKNPLCVMCQEQGRTVLADDVDHIIPHKGDLKLFYDIKNLQPLCKLHHQSTKARIERSGEFGCDQTGMPLDPEHHWHG